MSLVEKLKIFLVLLVLFLELIKIKLQLHTAQSDL